MLCSTGLICRISLFGKIALEKGFSLLCGTSFLCRICLLCKIALDRGFSLLCSATLLESEVLFVVLDLVRFK